MITKQNGGLLVREKQAGQTVGGAAKHSLKQTADSTVPQSQIVWTIEPLNQKSQKSQIAQEYGLLPADARQQLLNVSVSSELTEYFLRFRCNLRKEW